MAAVVHPNLNDFKCVAASLFAVSASVTISRLYMRAKKHQWWWDDTLAALAMVSMTLFVAGAAMLSDPKQTHSGAVTAYYLVVVGFYIPIWAARLSILYTIIRIAPLSGQRKILTCFAGAFVVMWAMLMIQVFWVCEISSTQWKSTVGGLCLLGKAIPVFQVTTTLIADTALIISPLWILRKVNVNRALRFRLLSAFFVSIATTIAAIAHAVLVIAVPGAYEAIFGAVEVGVALIVCNASVIIPVLARKFSTSDTFQDSEREIQTIGGGSSGNKNRNTTRLNALNMGEEGGETAIRVDVTVDQDRNNSRVWDLETKQATYVGDDESIIESPIKPVHGADMTIV